MFSPPATMNFTSDRFRLDSMDYKKLTRLHLKNPPSSGLKFLSKTLNIQRLVVVLREDVGFLDHDAPTCELPRSNSRYTGSRQHPIALVGNHSHRLRQLHLLDVGFLWWSQPQPRYQQRFRLRQYDHNLQPNHSRPSAPLHCPSDCGRLHTARQNPRRQPCDLCRRLSRLRGAHRLHCIQQLSRNGLHHSANRLRNNIWSNPHLGLPTRILHLHSSNNPSARRNGIPSNPYPASLQGSDLQSESMILC